MKIKSPLKLSALAFLFAVGAGTAFAVDYSCLAACKADLNGCMSEMSKPFCVGQYALCKKECGA